MNEAAAPADERATIISDPHDTTLQERERLLRFCTRLTGSADIAEDLVQESLFEAWRHEEQLRDPDRRAQWLFGIARNVFLRWARRRGRDVAALTADTVEDIAAATDNVELDMERDELAELLDRAMSLLPIETRRVLVERYVEDLPQAIIAEQLGVSEGAIAVRLHRGRLALRRVLLSDLREEAATYGLRATDDDGWEATRIWCSTCGMARVSALRNVEQHVFLVRCSHCGSTTSDRSAMYLHQVQGHTRAMIHSIRSARDLYFGAIAEGSAPCANCGAPVQLQRGIPPEFAGSTDPDHGVHMLCERCGALSHQPVNGLALSLPEAERFWRNNRRMRTLPAQQIESGGRAVLLTVFESVPTNDRLEVVLDLESFQVIDILA